MAEPNVANKLAQVPIFSECTKRELAIIARASKLVSHSIGGKTKARLGPGDFFGEVALLDGGPRTATVTATSAVRLVGITGWVFRGLLMEHPSIALRTLESVAGRLRSVTKEPV